MYVLVCQRLTIRIALIIIDNAQPNIYIYIFIYIYLYIYIYIQIYTKGNTFKVLKKPKSNTYMQDE